MATLATLTVKLIADAGKFGEGLSQAETRTQSFVSGVGKNMRTLGMVTIGGLTAAAGAAATAVGGLGVALGNMAVSAAPVEDMRLAFEGLAEGSGRGADELMRALQRGSAGMVAQRDLMETYNKAAGLVSTQFANELPDAMGYLSKVSAATGQDMGFLLDSLVTGVGRLSPMILDNLQIQVALSDATERAAEMFGVETDELTKAQQQAGMMNVVLEKLAANTAEMPNVTMGAAAGLARMKATFQDIKDRIGTALLPILNTLLATFRRLMDKVLPPLMSFLESRLIPVFNQVATFINAFVYGLTEGEGPIIAFQGALEEIMPDDLADKIQQLYTQLMELRRQIEPYIERAAAWISQNVKLEDVLAALGIAIASVVIPAIAGIISAVAPVVAVFVGLVAIIAGLRQAWETDFYGIRTAVLTLWENLQPVFTQLIEWFQTNIPVAVQFLADLWSNTLLPALQQTWQFIQENVIPVIAALADVFDAVLGVAMTALAGLWQNVLQPAFAALFAWIHDKFPPIFQYFQERIAPIQNTFKQMGEAIQGVVRWLGRLADRIRSISLPDWLTPGSPTPLELGLWGIAKAAEAVGRVAMPTLATGMGGLTGPGGGMVAAGVGVGAGGASVVINVNGAGDPTTVAQEVVRIMEDQGIVSSTRYR